MDKKIINYKIIRVSDIKIFSEVIMDDPDYGDPVFELTGRHRNDSSRICYNT